MIKILRPRQFVYFAFEELLHLWESMGLCTILHHDYDMVTVWLNRVGDVALNYFDDKQISWNGEYKAILHGNLVIEGHNNYPWVYWPKHPKAIDGVKRVAPYNTRDIETIWVGSRTTRERGDCKWIKPLSLFVMGEFDRALISQDNYIKLMLRSKFGLCIPGIGPKCHREIELMACGVVPIFTDGMSTDYHDPILEDVHYLYTKSPEDIPELISNCGKDKWEYISNNCREWFRKNCSVLGSYNTTMEILASIGYFSVI